MMNDDMLLTIDEGFDPEPHIVLKHYDQIHKLLRDLDMLVKPPYELVQRWKVTLARNNANMIKLLKILSLDRFKDNGERQKLRTDLGFKHTLVELDKILQKTPKIL